MYEFPTLTSQSSRQLFIHNHRIQSLMDPLSPKLPILLPLFHNGAHTLTKLGRLWSQRYDTDCLSQRTKDVFVVLKERPHTCVFYRRNKRCCLLTRLIVSLYKFVRVDRSIVHLQEVLNIKLLSKSKCPVVFVSFFHWP
jgi:hypothetical protein